MESEEGERGSTPKVRFKKGIVVEWKRCTKYAKYEATAGFGNRKASALLI